MGGASEGREELGLRFELSWTDHLVGYCLLGVEKAIRSFANEKEHPPASDQIAPSKQPPLTRTHSHANSHGAKTPFSSAVWKSYEMASQMGRVHRPCRVHNEHIFQNKAGALKVSEPGSKTRFGRRHHPPFRTCRTDPPLSQDSRAHVGSKSEVILHVFGIGLRVRWFCHSIGREPNHGKSCSSLQTCLATAIARTHQGATVAYLQPLTALLVGHQSSTCTTF